MKKITDFENYIFDLDGTLIDSMPVWDNIGVDFLLSKGITPPYDLKETLSRMSFKEAADYFINELGLKMSVYDIIKGVTETAADKYRFEIPFKKGVYKFLEESYKSGKHMSILTASEEYYIIPLLKRLKADVFFENIITCSNINMSKSSFEIYIAAAEKMGYAKEKTAVFEDALHGVENSKKAGFFTVAVFDEAEKENIEKIKSVADIYLESF